MTVQASTAGAALAQGTAALAAHEDRPGQQRMAEAVADAIANERHLVVQAGTGTGKTIAYVVPAILSEKRTVIATATKALQDQLATKDLPFLSLPVETDSDNDVLDRERGFRIGRCQFDFFVEVIAARPVASARTVVKWSQQFNVGRLNAFDQSHSKLHGRTSRLLVTD